MKRYILIAYLVWTFLFCGFAGAEMVPFVIDNRARTDSPTAVKSIPIKPGDGRVAADKHFYDSTGDRIRFWGVNLSFGANLPKKEDAPKIAARLAAAGANSVRLHHLDTANFPNGIWDAAGKNIDSQALERLDYFISELADNGIYIDLNLHVGRKHSAYLDIEEAGSNYDKVVNIFTPELLEAQKDYADKLLRHVNPWRNVSYAKDPAIAIVEITNENSFFMWDGQERLRNLAGYYKDTLQKQYNEWLRKRYGSDEKLRSVWGQGAEPLGQNMLKNSNFANFQNDTSMPVGWFLEQHEGCTAKLTGKTYRQVDTLAVDITEADNTAWHLQLRQTGLAVKKGQYYTVTFKGASVKQRNITCSVTQTGSPWAGLGLGNTVQITPEWKEFRLGFVASQSEENARITFAFGNDQTDFYLARAVLAEGGREGLGKDDSLENHTVQLFGQSEVEARINDRMQFLAETEKAYFDGMKDYIQNELGCGAMVTGTIAFGPLGLYAQQDMDFIDSHAYWQHPSFPGRAWDPANWIVEQKAMTDNPGQATLFSLAAQRLHNKPFTVTEYNHPAPNDYQAECVPMISAFAAIQDWDGVWLYTYSHSNDQWDRQQLNSFFDVDTNPAKWGFIRAGASVFREQAVTPRPYISTGIGQKDRLLDSLIDLHKKHDRNLLGLFSRPEEMLNTQVSLQIAGTGQDSRTFDDSTKTKWPVNEKGKGFFSVEGKGAWIFTGHSQDFEKYTDGRIIISEPQFISLAITSLDNKPLTNAKTILVTACGKCENSEMVFSQDRRTVGTNWGTAPVLIEPVAGSITLPPGEWRCDALGPDAMPKQKVNLAAGNGKTVLQMLPSYQTMWYLLSRDN